MPRVAVPSELISDPKAEKAAARLMTELINLFPKDHIDSLCLDAYKKDSGADFVQPPPEDCAWVAANAAQEILDCWWSLLLKYSRTVQLDPETCLPLTENIEEEALNDNFNHNIRNAQTLMGKVQISTFMKPWFQKLLELARNKPHALPRPPYRIERRGENIFLVCS